MSRILILVAVICFLLAALGASVPVVALVPFGLACWAAAGLV